MLFYNWSAFMPFVKISSNLEGKHILVHGFVKKINSKKICNSKNQLLN
jgi:hypothetical protein